MLITGFGPFPGAPANPTSWLIATLQERLGSGDPKLGLAFETLPASYRAVAAHAVELRTGKAPEIAVHFGLKVAANGFEIETLARNQTHRARVDAAGHRPEDHRVCTQAPRVLRTNAPARALVAELRRRGLPAKTSTDAGRYVCNALYFGALLARTETDQPGWDLFVHVPPTETAAKSLFAARGYVAPHAILPSQQLLQGALVLIETLAKMFARQRTQMRWA